MMKQLIIVALITLVLIPCVNADKTIDGYAACITEQWINDFVSFSVAKDMQSVESYINSGKCFIMKGGMSVTVLKTRWTGLKQCAWRGQKFWTFSEAIQH